MRFILVNPNTDPTTTAAMVDLAEAAAPGVVVTGMTAPFGARLITDKPSLAEAARAVASLAPEIARSDVAGVIVAAFGDPGLQALRESVAVPVTGIGEAGMAEGAAGGRRFAVVTTTPGLVPAIAGMATGYGHDRFVGVWVTFGDPHDVMANQARLLDDLRRACLRAIADGGADAIVIGGGPLAVAARALVGTVGVPIVEPVPAAVRLAVRRCDVGVD